MRKYWRGFLWGGLIIGTIVTLLRVFLLRIWVVPTDDKLMAASVAPSLAPGDVVLLFTAGTPGFSDLVRCTDPEEPRRFVIARIAGEAGDNVLIEGPTVIVNEKRATLEHACSPHMVTILDPNTDSPVEIKCDFETLGGSSHKRGTRAMGDVARVERAIPQGFVWLLSDNRAYPDDSRLFGAVRPESCDGRIIFRIWSAKGFFDTANRFTWIN
ncbi:MAG: signal peptidase I [Deltaproteobacteria bacterium]|nr:signal peptidase I [Deltaproteobacteria bacterium]